MLNVKEKVQASTWCIFFFSSCIYFVCIADLSLMVYIIMKTMRFYRPRNGCFSNVNCKLLFVDMRHPAEEPFQITAFHRLSTRYRLTQTLYEDIN